LYWLLAHKFGDKTNVDIQLCKTTPNTIPMTLLPANLGGWLLLLTKPFLMSVDMELHAV